MSIPTKSKSTLFIRRLLFFGVLFFGFTTLAQNSPKKIFQDIKELSITKEEKMKKFKSKLLYKDFPNTEAYAEACYLVAREAYKFDKTSGVEFLKKELELRKKNQKTDSTLIAKCMYNLIVFNKALKKYNVTSKYCDSLFAFQKKPDGRLGKAYCTKADIYKRMGDYERATAHYDQSEAILKKVKSYKDLPGTYINKLALLVTQKEGITEEDFEILQQKISDISDKVTLSDNRKLMIAFNSAGLLYHFKKYSEALALNKTSLELAEKVEDSIQISKIYGNIGLIYMKEENDKEALSMFNTALLYTQNDRDQKSTIYDNLGDFYAKNKAYELALKNYNKALNSLVSFEWETIENLPDYKHIINSPFQKTILSYLVDKQNHWLRMHRELKDKKYLLEAEKTLVLIDRIIDYIYFESKEKLSKFFWRREGAKLYINAVKICYQLQKPEKAFYYMEKNKGLLLLENISKEKAIQLLDIPQALIDEEKILLKNINQLEQQFSENKTEAYFQAKEAYYTYQEKIEKQYPNYKRYRTNIPIQTATEIQRKLQNDEMIVSYIIGDDYGYVLWMNSDQIAIEEISEISQLQNQLESFKKLYVQPFERQLDISKYQKQGFELYRKLMPFQNDTTFQKATKIVIVPDGKIHELSFDVLPTSATQKLSDSYLIRTKEISYCYSFSLDAQNESKKRYFNFQKSSFLVTRFKDSSLVPLQKASIKLLENSMYVDSLATKENFLNAYDNASQVYISSHAGNLREKPWIALYDGKVYADDLYFKNNAKELVVLNACETSSGIYKEGEGIFSLTRGFLNSGSKSVVSSLWNVNEKSGAEIFATFQENLKASQSKSEALRNAKLAYLDAHANTSQSSPYYWGTMILTGNRKAIASPFPYWLWIFGFGIISVFVWFQIRRKKQRIS